MSATYQLAIENLAKQKDPYLFENTGPFHAAVVMGNIFETATKYVNIFAGDFNGAVSDKAVYLDGLGNYLERKKPLSIIFEREPNPNSLALQLIRKYARVNNNIDIRILNEDKDGNEQGHFTIADDRMFRYEKSKDEYKALCSFNNISVVETLETKFSELLQKSTPLNSN